MWQGEPHTDGPFTSGRRVDVAPQSPHPILLVMEVPESELVTDKSCSPQKRRMRAQCPSEPAHPV